MRPAPPPLVSVLIAVYDAEAYLGEAIDSVLGQSYSPVEVIVVDDGSMDGSGEVARGYGDSVRYLRQEHAGQGAARNRGLGIASGSLICLLDADDRFVRRKLALQHAALEVGELEAVYGRVREFVSPELTPEQRARLRPPSAVPMPWVSPTVGLITREAFDRVGPFSETLRVGVTVDWTVRAEELGLRSAVLADTVVERRLHAANNGLREAESRSDYVKVVRASLRRRRAAAG